MTRVNDTVLGRVGDHAASEAMRGAGNVEQDFRQHAHWDSAGETRQLLGEFVGLRNVGGHLVAAADQKFAEGPEPGPLPAHVNVRVDGLHAKQDETFARPAEGLEYAECPDGMTQGLIPEVLQPQRNSGRAGAATLIWASQSFGVGERRGGRALPRAGTTRPRTLLPRGGPRRQQRRLRARHRSRAPQVGAGNPPGGAPQR